MNQLRARVIIILIAAALPAILLVGLVAYRIFDFAKAAAIDALQRDVSLLTSRLEAAPLGSARVAWLVATAASWDPRINENCARNLQDALTNFTGYSSVVLYRDGRLLCSAGLALADARAPTTQQFNIADLAPGDRRSGVWTVADPVIFSAARGNDANANFTAVVIVDPEFLGSLLAVFRSLDSSSARLVDRTGVDLGKIRTPGSAPELGPLLSYPLPDGGNIVVVSNAEGVRYVVTAHKLPSPDAWVVTQQRENDVLADARSQLTLTLMAPVLTLLLVGLGVWLGLTRFVLTWINRLSSVTRAYASGDLSARVGDTTSAPAEIAQLANRFDGLADRMAERAVELEGEVVQKRRYIRELHHRVKNNLQVIASLLALQKRNLPDDQRAVLRFPEDRVNAMAAAYGVSYAQTEGGEVGVMSVMREVITRLQAGVDSGHPHVRVSFSGTDQQVDLDAAIAVAMLFAELLPRFLDQSTDSQNVTLIDVSVSGDRLMMLVDAPAATELPVNRLSDRFTRAYVRQLNAMLEEQAPGKLRLTIPIVGRAQKSAVA